VLTFVIHISMNVELVFRFLDKINQNSVEYKQNELATHNKSYGRNMWVGADLIRNMNRCDDFTEIE